MVDRNPLNRLESSGYDRQAAEQDLKDTAIEASQHSSGDVLDMAHKDSAYAHGNEHMLNSVDENTTMPSADTTTKGAYSLGKTSTASVAQNYDQEFPERDTHTVGTGSRTIQTLPSHVEDLGTTVQTNRTRHVVETERDPVQYIAPSSNIATTSGSTSYGTQAYGTTGSARQTSGNTTGYTTGATEYDTVHATSSTTGHAPSNNTGMTTGTTTHTTGLPTGQSGVVQHHGLVGENKTIDPSAAKYELNAGSGAAVGTSTMGIPHGTKPATGHQSTNTSGVVGHESNTKQKESMMSKIKHAFGK